jgi:hypothetical protein
MAVSKRRLGIGKQILFVAGALLATSPLNAQTCDNGTIFCTQYGYECTTQTCNQWGNACCSYSCVKPTIDQN